ncbi:Choline trimethylamine-lyase [Propionicimonas sp. T2.31MG-18]|uniref:glycine radical domain-containing protein n=1 Tax=Propionicimonas sp. T2.31MG-18 TaxID=3157620 RepID=UPI0035E623B1
MAIQTIEPTETFREVERDDIPVRRVQGDTGLQRLVHLMDYYFDRGGMQMQFNVVSRETLLKAQAEPEKYKSLVVRVAGYSAYFVGLEKMVQQDIIERTEERL